MDVGTDYRPTCYRCFKPQQLCICLDVPTVFNRTGVTILQHPRECHHPIGTVRIARLGLQNVRILVHSPHQGVAPIRTELPQRTALLFPGGRPLSALAAHERPEHLLVLDGTWNHARQLLRTNTWLHGLPRVHIEPAAPSHYRIRGEPAEHCVSTIEAIVAALVELEPETVGLDGLLGAFDRMIDQQITFVARQQLRRRHRRKRRAETVLSTEDLVLCYAETVGSGNDAVYWAATRPATGEFLAHAIARSPCVTVSQAEMMGLEVAVWDHALSPAAFADAWARFATERDTLVAWYPRTLACIAHPGPTLLLKSLYCSRSKASCGHLEQLITSLGRAPTATPLHGRPAARMGATLAMLKEFTGEREPR